MLYFWLALFGLSVGSFLNVCIDRYPNIRSIVAVRSHCEACGRVLTPWELVPLFSYLALGGRCRGCRERIPLRLPLVEALTAGLFALTGAYYGLTLSGLLVLVYLSVLVVLFFVDLERMVVPNRFIYPALLAAFLLAPLRPVAAEGSIVRVAIDSVAGGALGGGVLLVFYLAARGGLGAGDVKLGAFIGLVVGWPLVLVALPVSFVAAGSVAIVLLALRLRGRRDAMPFGPFLGGAGMVTMFWGRGIADIYLGVFGLR